MKLNMVANNSILSNLQRKNIQHKAFENNTLGAEGLDLLSVNGTPAVKVSISAEGKNSCRDSLQMLQPECESYDSVAARKNELITMGKKFQSLSKDYRFEIGTRYELISKKYRTTEEKASELLKAYGDIYNEIVQGYESGQRERYTLDSTSEDGFRKMTMSEEIDELNESYKGYAEFIELEAKRAPEYAAVYESMANDMAKDAKRRGFEQSEDEIRLRDTASKMRSEILPDDIGGKMMAAVEAFVKQYEDQRNIGVENIVKNINIF